MIEGSDSALYGTTNNGGQYGAGIMYRINKDGTGFTILHDFQDVPANGATPVVGVIEG